MLDQATLALLAKLKVLAKKAGINIDLVKMSGDRAYAELILKELSNADDSELVLVAVQTMNRFGMIAAPAEQTATETRTAEGRYVGKLR